MHQWKVHVSFLRSTDASNDLLDSERNIPPAATGRASAEWKTDNWVKTGALINTFGTMSTLWLPMRSVSDLRGGRAAHSFMSAHTISYRRGIFSGILIMDGRFWKKTWGFLLAVTDARFLFRLQQQRPEDGVQTTRAVCKLQRAGLAGRALFFHLLHPNAIYTESDLCWAVWDPKARQPAYSVRNYLTNGSISYPNPKQIYNMSN